MIRCDFVTGGMPAAAAQTGGGQSALAGVSGLGRGSGLQRRWTITGCVIPDVQAVRGLTRAATTGSADLRPAVTEPAAS